LRIVLLGAPGAGKGTTARLLAKADGSVQISTGDLLRAAVGAGTPLGKQAKARMDRGELVPDALILEMMAQRLREPDCRRGFLLDGFPRTLAQARALEPMLAGLGMRLDLVVDLVVPRAVVIERLATRRTCSNPACQAIYNVKSAPPKVEGQCDACGSPVVQRADETEEAIAKRLDTYEKQSAPLVDYYRREGLLFEVDSIDSVAAARAIASKVAEPAPER
jgi:adenylate kinase